MTYFLICWTFAITKARGTPISSVVVGWNTFCYLRNEKLQPYKHWSIEEVTGIDFFFNLPDDIEDSVESHSDISRW